MTYVATAALLLIVATLPVIGGALLAPFLLGLFLLALVGVFTRHADGNVRQHDTTLDPCGWRDCA